MITFTDSEKAIIKEWLNGSHNYFTKVSLVARWNTKILSDSLVQEGETLDSRSGLSTSSNPERDLQLIENSPLPPQQEILNIYNVRFKRSGIKQDMSFRSPTLTFTWSDYYGFLQGKDQKAIRFYLKIALVGEGISGELVLLKTGFYKIKKAEAVYSTSKSSGADYEIEAVPWVYEYNDKVELGPNGGAWLGSQNLGDWDNDSRFGAYLVSLTRLQKVKHDLNNLKVANYPSGPAEYFPDAPSAYTGPFLLLNNRDGTVTNLSADKKKRLYLFDFVEETPISLIQRSLFTDKVIVSDTYAKEEPLDTPLIRFIALRDQFTYWKDAESIPDENTFYEIENSDGEVIKDSIYSYSVRSYSMELDSNILAYYKTATTEFSKEVSGVIELSNLVYKDNQSGSTPENFTLTLIAYIRREISGGTLAGPYTPFESSDSGNKVRVYGIPRSTEKSVSKIIVRAYYGKTYSTVDDIPPKVAGDAHHVDIDAKFNVQSYYKNFPSPGDFFRMDILGLYAEDITKVVRFNAEFRPWINIFDPIRLKVMDSFGQYHWVRALISDIDANIDSFSASYEAMVIKEE